MTGNCNTLAGVVLGAAMLVAGDARAGRPAPPSAQPPAEWAQYIADVRKADDIGDHEARCLAYPDLPGNDWRPGAAAGRCSVLRAPAFPLDRVAQLLATPEGMTELERGFAVLLDGHYRDQAQRDQIFVALNVFDHSVRAGEVARRWVQLAPKSAFAHAALGIHLGTSGWEARGTAYASRTPEQKLERMAELFAQAVPEYVKALELEPRLSVACYKLNGIGRQSSDALQQYAQAHCMRIDPDSYFLALEWITSAEPRWGGSLEQLRQAVAYAAARIERNPMMGALLGEAAGYSPSVADDLRSTADELATAARMGPSASLSGRAGYGYKGRNDTWRALVHLSQATRFRPDDADYRYARASVLFYGLRDAEWARSDLRIALAHEPEDESSHLLMALATEVLEGPAAARPHYKRAMKGSVRRSAMQRYCSTYLRPPFDGKIDECSQSLVAEFPDSSDAWQLRAWALYYLERPEAVDAAARFKLLADTQNQRHRDDIEAMKGWSRQFDAGAKRAAGGGDAK